MTNWNWNSLLLFASIFVCPAWASAQQENADFFETKIRPVLVQKCVSCHGPDQQEAGLRLDSAEGLKTGGDQGTLLPQDQQASLLLDVLGYEGDIQMPPDGKLTGEQIVDFQHWVNAGAPWPEAAAPLSNSIEDRRIQDRAQHWAFQPIVKPSIPEVSNPLWQSNPIDALLADRLASHDLLPSPKATDRTLVRRLYFDLLGLPATPQQIADYAFNSSPNRWEQLIEQLLAKPQYGERWGRYWLDVARYADTQGYAFAQDRRYPHAYTYRDYVIQAFNQDLPFDQFVMEQLAADQMDLGEDNSELAALGFITVGRRFINGHDTIDDCIDVVTRGLMGLTVQCARCHDHKYDAIPIEDYYSLYGVFASTEEPGIKPVFGPKAQVEQRQAFETKQRELQAQLDQFRNQKVEEQKQTTRQRLEDYLYAIVAPPEGMNVEQVDSRVSLDDQALRPRMVRRWRDRFHHYQHDRNETTAVFRPFSHLMALPKESFPEAVAQQLAIWRQLNTPASETTPPASPSETPADVTDVSAPPTAFPYNRDPMLPMIVDKLEQANLQTPQDVARFYADLIRQVWTTFEEHGSNDDAVLKVEEPLRLIIDLKRAPDSPWNIPAGEIGLYLSDSDFQQLQEREQVLNTHNATAPPELPRAMAVNDRQHMHQPHVFLRGSEANLGPQVPRHYLTLLTAEAPQPYPDNASGRLQLAQQIVSPDNPLTARVIANRVWMYHFGAPLVDTPSDFGVRCEEPIQRDVLDYLAAYLQENQWSIKSLHRLILTSQAYQQQSANRADAVQEDPENRLIWRMNRRRMDWESLRDGLYAVAGQLDLTVGGPAIDMFRSQPSQRRSIYGTIDRQDLPNLLRSFDFASPDSSSAKRPQTTVPQQALFLMNGEMLGQLSQQLLHRDDVPPAQEVEHRLAWLFRRIYLRDITDNEAEMCRAFLQQVELPNEGENLEQRRNDAHDQRWAMLVQALLMSNEFCFVD